jgi:hypothetical protein
MPEPTARDLENAARRQAIAERQQAEYNQVLLWALGTFGPGWLPSCRHFLVDHAEEARVRYTNKRPQIAATVYTVKRDDGCKRHFTADAVQQVRAALLSEDGRLVRNFAQRLGNPYRRRAV